jgi:hypothetical protein
VTWDIVIRDHNGVAMATFVNPEMDFIEPGVWGNAETLSLIVLRETWVERADLMLDDELIVSVPEVNPIHVNPGDRVEWLRGHIRVFGDETAMNLVRILSKMQYPTGEQVRDTIVALRRLEHELTHG